MAQDDYGELLDAAKDLEQIVDSCELLDVCPALQRRLLDLQEALEAEIADHPVARRDPQVAS
jgi:hypothetical protein